MSFAESYIYSCCLVLLSKVQKIPLSFCLIRLNQRCRLAVHLVQRADVGRALSGERALNHPSLQKQHGLPCIMNARKPSHWSCYWKNVKSLAENRCFLMVVHLRFSTHLTAIMSAVCLNLMVSSFFLLLLLLLLLFHVASATVRNKQSAQIKERGREQTGK